MLSCNVSYFCYLGSVVYSVVGRLFVRVGGYMRFEKGKDVWSPIFLLARRLFICCWLMLGCLPTNVLLDFSKSLRLPFSSRRVLYSSIFIGCVHIYTADDMYTLIETSRGEKHGTTACPMGFRCRNRKYMEDGWRANMGRREKEKK